MAFILASLLKTHYYDEDGNKISTPLDDENGILTNIKRYVRRFNKIVYVVNDPDDLEHNDISVPPVFEGFEKTGIRFKEKLLLDRRNAKEAESVLSGADLIILGGGKILCQLAFFKDIGLKSILKNTSALVIGVSAGAMNLCTTVVNFPEEPSDVGQPLWAEGLGFYDRMIIPHFDGENVSYQLPFEEIDVVKDYVLPMSAGREFLGLPNGSYILVDGDKADIYGDAYSISDGVVTKRN